MTRYAPFVPRRPSAIGRALHETSIGLRALQLLRGRVRAADLVIATSPPPFGAACAVWVAKRHGKPCVVLAYDLAADLASDTFGLAGRVAGGMFRVLEARLYARADTVVALTDDMAERIRLLAKRPAPVPVIRIWADDELRHLDHAAAAKAWRARVGIPEERRLIGFAGNFGQKQHLPEIVEAIRDLPSSYTTVFIGDGPDRTAMERVASGASGDVRILPPQLTADLHAFLSACDVSIVAAWTKHPGSLFPSKVANILAAGSPILAITDRCTELATLLEEKNIGLTCPSLDPGRIREATRHGVELGRDGDRRARCRHYAADHFDKDRAMRCFLTEVSRLVPWRQSE